jgi:hypothetical protein
MKNGEEGLALVITLVLVAFGVLVITPFLGNAGSSMIGSRAYGQAITEQYSGDAGVEHAIWDLTYDDLADNLTSPGDNVSYSLGEAINGVVPDITVVKTDNTTYEITSVANSETICAVVEISGVNVTVSQWQINP